MGYDLIVRNGIVVDGTGLARRRADVGVRDGRIVDVGHVPDSVAGAQVIDADGLFVAPGIIDAHTHYDPQLTFDRGPRRRATTASPPCWPATAGSPSHRRRARTATSSRGCSPGSRACRP